MLIRSLLTILIVFLDVGWGEFLAFFGAIPNLTLVWIFVQSLKHNDVGVFYLAFISGLLKDILVGTPLGLTSFGLLVVAGLTLVLKDKILQLRPLTWVLLLTFLTLIFPFILGQRHFSLAWKQVLYHLVLLGVMVPWIGRRDG